MPRETVLWATVKAHLSPFGSVERVENLLSKGTPDVTFGLTHPPSGRKVSGWCELKQLANWPVRGGMVNIPHLTLEQVRWLETWHGLAFMLLRVGNAYVAADPALTRAIHERTVTAAVVIKRAGVYSEGRFPTGDLLRWLVSRST